MENNENNVQNQEKKQSKGMPIGVVIIMLIAFLIAGIGGGYLLSNNDSLFNKNETKSNNNSNNATQSNNNTSVENNTTEQNTATQAPTELTADELKDLENYLNNGKYNGFVSLNLYKSIDEIDMGMVFYNVQANPTQEEIEDFLNGNIHATAITKVTMSEIKDRMYQGTGKHFTDDEIKSLMGWNYLSKYDAFYLQRGDTSYSKVTCQSGTKTNDGLYKVILTGAVEYEYDDDYTNIKEIKDTLLTVKKEGDSYKFISHVINTYKEKQLTSNNTNTKITSEEYAKYYIEKIKSLDYVSDSTKYGLLDISGSNIPYLVVDTGGDLSIYKINNNTVVSLKERDSYGTHGRDGYDYIEGTNIMRDYCTFEEGYAYEIYDDLFNYKYCVECTFSGEYRHSENNEKKTITEEEFNKLSYKNSTSKHLRDVANKSKEEIIKVLENK